MGPTDEPAAASTPTSSDANGSLRRASSRQPVRRLFADVDFETEEPDPFETDGESDDEYRPAANPKRRSPLKVDAKRAKPDEPTSASGDSDVGARPRKRKPKKSTTAPKPTTVPESTALIGLEVRTSNGDGPRIVAVSSAAATAEKKRRNADRLSAVRSLLVETTGNVHGVTGRAHEESGRLVALADPQKIGRMGDACASLVAQRRHFLAAHRSLAEAEAKSAAALRAFAAAYDVEAQLRKYEPLQCWLNSGDDDCVIVNDDVDEAVATPPSMKGNERPNLPPTCDNDSDSDSEPSIENASPAATDGENFNTDSGDETAKCYEDANVTDSRFTDRSIINEIAKAAMLSESPTSSPTSFTRHRREFRACAASKFVNERTLNVDAIENESHTSDRSVSDGEVKPCSPRSPQDRSPPLSSESDESDNPDNIITVTSKKRKLSKKGRRTICRIISDDKLNKNTHKAIEEERYRLRRIAEKEDLIKNSRLENCKEVVLDCDFTTGENLLSVHPGFLKVLKSHQIDGVEFMWRSCFESIQAVVNDDYGTGCILAHCMGLGKTLQVIALVHTVLTSHLLPVKKVLVCCPLSVVLNWVDEFNKWLDECIGNRSITIYEISRFRKNHQRGYLLEEWNHKGGVLIVGYEMFRHLTTLTVEKSKVEQIFIDRVNSILLNPGPDVVICDEGHLLKNSSTILAMVMSKIVTKRRIVLTGTPLQNNLKEYYHMINFVKPNLLGSQKEFSNRFICPITNGQHRDSTASDINLMKKRSHVLHKMLEGSVQRKEATVLYNYLPPKQEYVLLITLSPFQSSLYSMYLDHIKKTPTGVNNRSSLFINFYMFQKIWTHPKDLFNEQPPEWYYSVKQEKDFEIQKVLEISHKFIVALQLLDECVKIKDKVVIFFSSLYNIDVFEYFLGERKGWKSGREYYRLDGNINIDDRKKLCHYFNSLKNNTVKLFLVSARVGSLGVNMIGANRVIIMDVSWNPSQDIQSIFRTYRFGQKKECFIYRLVANGTMEEKVYERSVTKQAVSRRVIDEEQIDRHYNMAELAELYDFACLPQEARPTPLFPKDRVLAVTISKLENCSTSAYPIIWSIHEHDSLLKNINEERLNEDDRRAAWLEYEKEKDDELPQNKQINTMQNPQILISNVISLCNKNIQDNNSSFQSENSAKHSNTTGNLSTETSHLVDDMKKKDIVCFVPIANRKHFTPLKSSKSSFKNQRYNVPPKTFTSKPQNTSNIAETSINVEEHYSYVLPNGKIVRKSPKKTPKKVTNGKFSTIDLTTDTPKSKKGNRSPASSRSKGKSMHKRSRNDNTKKNFARRLEFQNSPGVESFISDNSLDNEMKTADVEN